MTSLWRHSRLTYYDLDLIFLAQGVELLPGEVWQVSKRNSQYFRSYLRKITGGLPPPPPSGAEVKVYPPTEFGVSSSKFSCTGGAHVKKVFRLWRVQPAPHRNGNHKSTHVGAIYVWPVNLGSVGPAVWPAVFTKSLWNLHAAARATCHVRRAPVKSAESRVRRLGLPTLKIWCKCPELFSRQTVPESSTDRQTDRQTEGRQKVPTYPPSINLRNTKNHHMLNHMNFPLSSYDFGLKKTYFEIKTSLDSKFSNLITECMIKHTCKLSLNESCIQVHVSNFRSIYNF